MPMCYLILLSLIQNYFSFFLIIFISWDFLLIRPTSSLSNILSSQRTEENVYIYRDIIL